MSELSKEDRDATILRLWADGQTSNQIAVNMGLTRNIVMGIVYRARKRGESVDPAEHHAVHSFSERKRLERAKETHQDPTTPTEALMARVPLKVGGPGQGKRNVRPPTLPPLASEPVKIFPTSSTDNTSNTSKRRGVPIYKLQADGCKFPIGANTRGEHVFCNLPSYKRDYCKAHYEVCFVKPTKQNTTRASFTWAK